MWKFQGHFLKISEKLFVGFIDIFISFYFIHFSRLNSISIILFWENTRSASKNYKYSKFRIILIIPVCNLTLHLTLPYFLPSLTIHLTLPYILPYRMSYLTLPYLMSYLTVCYLTLPYLMSYLTLQYITLPYHTLPYLTTHYLTLPYLMSYLTLP